MLGFMVVQAAAVLAVIAAARAAGIDIRIASPTLLDLPRTLALCLVNALVALGGAALVPWLASWREVGMRASAVQQLRGWIALLPVGAVVVLPGVAVALSGEADLVDSSIGPAQAAAFVLLALAVSAAEELWFRGLVVAQLGGLTRPWTAIVGSALLFGLPHVRPEPAALLNALGVTLAVGIPFAVVRLRCGALLPLIGWHAVIDIWAFLHTASVAPVGERSAGEIAAGIILPASLALGYAAWFRRSGAADTERVARDQP